MARKEFNYKGYNLQQLQELTLEELTAIYPSRARRSLKRGLNPKQKDLIEKLKKSSDPSKPVRTHCRDLPVLPIMVGKSVAIYNGKQFMKIDITPEMIGHFLGEFAMPRGVVRHSAPGVGATRSSLFVPIK